MGSLPRTHIYRQIKSIPETHFNWIKTAEKFININISNHVWMLCLHFSFQSDAWCQLFMPVCQHLLEVFFVLLRANVIMWLVNTKDTVASFFNRNSQTQSQFTHSNVCPIVQDAFTITVRWKYAILSFSYSKALISHLLYIKGWDP